MYVKELTHKRYNIIMDNHPTNIMLESGLEVCDDGMQLEIA